MSTQATYHRSIALWTSLYAALVAAISWTPLGEQFLSGPYAYLIAALPAVPVAGMMLSVLRHMNSADEFVRALLAKRFVVAAGLTFVGCAFWGFLESFARAPHIELWLVFPAFWAAFALVTPFVKTTR